jgi:hypothetical protein
MPTPNNMQLYNTVKAEADAKFLAPTSAYKSAWIVREYKKRGGTYKEDGEPRGLTQWFQEKWVDLNRPTKKGFASCGRNVATTEGVYPLCRPSQRVNTTTPKTIREIDPMKVATLKKQKNVIKQRGRVSF